MQAVLPEALPKRFGDFEPLRHKPEGSDFTSFFDLWASEVENDVAMLFFKSTAPCFGGGVICSDPRKDEDYPEHSRLSMEIQIEFDGRAFSDDIWCNDISSFFYAASNALEAFYAIGYLESGYTTRRNNLSITAGNLTKGKKNAIYPFPHIDRWVGIPPYPTWLTWFGAPYAEIFRPFIKSTAVELQSGFGASLGTVPSGLSPLEGQFFDLPDEYVAAPTARAALTIPEI